MLLLLVLVILVVADVILPALTSRQKLVCGHKKYSNETHLALTLTLSYCCMRKPQKNNFVISEYGRTPPLNSAASGSVVLMYGICILPDEAI